MQHGFTCCHYDPNLYLNQQKGEVVIIVIYVDDLVITGSIDILINETKIGLKRSFDMTDLGFLQYCLGLEIWQTPGCILIISQIKYTKTLLEKFITTNCQPMATPMEPGLQMPQFDDSP